jgi:hypothetical protein
MLKEYELIVQKFIAGLTQFKLSSLLHGVCGTGISLRLVSRSCGCELQVLRDSLFYPAGESLNWEIRATFWLRNRTRPRVYKTNPPDSFPN